MKAPVREEVIKGADRFNKQYTVREAIEWWKRIYLNALKYEPLAESEVEFLDSGFKQVIERTAVNQKLPHGPLGQFVSQVAMSETIDSMMQEVLT